MSAHTPDSPKLRRLRDQARMMDERLGALMSKRALLEERIADEINRIRNAKPELPCDLTLENFRWEGNDNG